MNTKPLLTGTAGPGSVAGRSTITSVLLPLLLLLVLPGLAQAQFNYFVEDGEVTIASYSGPGGEVIIPDNIDGLPVIRIGTAAFYFCTSLTSVTIPDSVTSIGSDAFYSCSGLTSITMGTSVSSIGDMAFAGCTGLTSLTIPDSVITIGSGAFIRCSGLSTITIPNRVIYIGARVFWACSNLAEISVDVSNPAFCSEDGVLFDKNQTTLIQCPPGKTGDLGIPDTVTNFSHLAFEGCSGLTSVTIPDGVTEIADSAFASCSGLTTLTIGDGVTSIGGQAFHRCTGLTSVAIPDNVTSIGWGAFSECTGLTTLTIGNGVTSIGAGAFSECTRLIDISIPNSVTEIGESAFASCTGLTTLTIGNGLTSIGGRAFSECTGLIDISIPESVTSIGAAAFEGCTALTSVTIPYSVSNLGRDPFRGCTNLSSISVDALNQVFSGLDGVLFNRERSKLLRCPEGKSGSYSIPDGVLSIENSAFEYCIGLSHVTIPDSVTIIGYNAFSNCSGLSSITIGNGVTSIDGSAAFAGCISLTAINVDVLNPVYSSLDGVLFDKSQNTLIKCPTGKTGDYTIPDTTVSVGEGAFSRCTGLLSVTIPDSVISLGVRAFEDCSGLTGVEFGNGVTRIGEMAFAGCISLTDVSISDSVTSIEGWAFSSCTSLTSIVVPNRVTGLSRGVFAGCTSLTSVTIPGSVIRIGSYAFADCTSLTSVTIPSSVSTIESGAFLYCPSLDAVYFEGDAPVIVWVMYGSEWIPDLFEGTPATVYYRPGTSGWGAEFYGRPTMPWGVVWGSEVRGDVDGDDAVDRNDLSLVVASRNLHAVDSEDPRDLDGDGMITVLDARILVTLFSVPGGFLRAAASPEGVVLDWAESAGAVRLQSTTDLQSGTWQDVGGLQSSTNAVIDTSAERIFFRLVLPE